MSTNSTHKTSGRLAGGLYLLVAVTGSIPFAIQQTLIVTGDAARTAANIRAAAGLYRLSMAIDVSMTACWIVTAYALAVLFKAVGRHAGALMVAFVLVGSATVCTKVLVQMAALGLLQGADAFSAWPPAERDALAMLCIGAARYGVLVSDVFFGLWLFPLGYLVFRSGYFPALVGRLLGLLLFVAGLGYLADFGVGCFLPATKVTFAQFTFVGELLLLLWLLIRGVRRPDPRGPVIDTTS